MRDLSARFASLKTLHPSKIEECGTLKFQGKSWPTRA
jgi:hypothetical protein